MLGLLGILTIASSILTLSEISLLQQIQADEEVTDSDIDAHDNLGIILAILLIGTYVGCATLFSMWKHRASKNLAPLGVSNQRFSPRWAVAYYFIPILNLFRPYQAMKEIYLRSGGGGYPPLLRLSLFWPLGGACVSFQDFMTELLRVNFSKWIISTLT